MKPLRLFRYSGSKTRFLKYYRQPASKYHTVVEPYLGSGSYSLNLTSPALGYEMNASLVAMWHWLQVTSPGELRDLGIYLQDWRNRQDKPDVRDMKLPLGPETYVRINTASVMVGQLSSWKVYPQHRLPVDETSRCLARIKDIQVIHGNGEEHSPRCGEHLFIDPPYLGTTANYLDHSTPKASLEGKYNPSATKELIKRAIGPVTMTYGSNAQSLFPEVTWELVKTRKVPNMRSGGTVDRTEWVAYFNHEGQPGNP